MEKRPSEETDRKKIINGMCVSRYFDVDEECAIIKTPTKFNDFISRAPRTLNFIFVVKTKKTLRCADGR